MRLSAYIVLVLLLVTASCSKFRKIQKSGDWELKYEAAMNYYQEEEYYKASVLFEEIIPIIRGSEKAEKAQFYFAYSYYHQKQYILAAHYFETFYRTYSRSDFAHEAMFMHAYSLYLQSPKYNLDQSSTYEAVQAMQNFLNKFPQSEFRKQGTDIIDELQRKLENKAYENAKQYHKLRRYKAALISFNNFRRDFPDSKLVEEIIYLQIDAQFKLADASIISKKKERYYETIEMYEEFVDNYPESKFVKPAGNIYEDSITQIGKLSKNGNY